MKRSWIMLLLCVVVFIVLRLLPAKYGREEESRPLKPSIPEPQVVQNALLYHPWVMAQPNLTEPNMEMVRDLAALDAFCKHVQSHESDLSYNQIVQVLMGTLTKLQEQIPFELPDTYYSVLCISETPREIYGAPIPFQVYKRLYLGEMDCGLPFYLDVRVFDLDAYPAEDLILWHLDLINGEAKQLYQANNRVIYTATGERTGETAHGFAVGERGLFIDCIEKGGRLYILYAEAPLKNFEEQELLFKQLVENAYE